MVVQDVYAEEEDDVDDPPAEGDAVRLEEEGRARAVKLRGEADDGDEKELDTGKEGSFTFWRNLVSQKEPCPKCHRRQVFAQPRRQPVPPFLFLPLFVFLSLV